VPCCAVISVDSGVTLRLDSQAQGLERAAGQTFLPTTEKLKWSPCVVKYAANNFDTSVAATHAAPGNNRAAAHAVRVMDLADSPLANHSTGADLAIQQDLSITRVRSSETWDPLKWFTSSITDFVIDTTLSEIEREMAATKRSRP
jgi:hypothetical protein